MFDLSLKLRQVYNLISERHLGEQIVIPLRLLNKHTYFGDTSLIYNVWNYFLKTCLWCQCKYQEI